MRADLFLFLHDSASLRSLPRLRLGHITRCLWFDTLTKMLAYARTSQTPKTLSEIALKLSKET
jgi:hypothetical protein